MRRGTERKQQVDGCEEIELDVDRDRRRNGRVSRRRRLGLAKVAMQVEVE